LFLIFPPLPSSTLFPYTTLFRSIVIRVCSKFCVSLKASVGELFIGSIYSSLVIRGEELDGPSEEMLLSFSCAPMFVSIRKGKHRSEEHTSELQSPCNLVCRLLLE